jgi:hypothetical protein
MHRRKRIATVVAAGATLLAVAFGALALAGAWPFASDAGEGALLAGEPLLWQGHVTLAEGASYALDVQPPEDEQGCAIHCFSIRGGPRGRISLSAGNGILGWPHAAPPSYFDCIALRNKTTLDEVALGAPRTSLAAVALHGWMCATGGGNDGLLRLRYDGREGRRYRFDVRSWGRPAEG